MAITRQKQREVSRKQREVNLRDSRHLRSGALIATLPSIETPLHRSRQARRTRLQCSTAGRSHADRVAVSEQPTRPGTEHNTTDGPGSLHVTGAIGESPNSCLESMLNIRQELLPLPSPQHPQLAEGDGGPTVIDHLASHNLHEATSRSSTSTPLPVETVIPGPDDLAKVGIPKDGNWAVVAAYGRRFCIEHAEDEWLLKNADRWMYPKDFAICKAEEKLEARLQKFTRNGWDLKWSHLASQADCNRSLWSHVDTPIQRARIGDRTILLIRWKLCWTPQSNIDNIDWVKSSYKKHRRAIGRRQTERVQDTDGKMAAKRKGMMTVAKLEDLLSSCD